MLLQLLFTVNLYEGWDATFTLGPELAVSGCCYVLCTYVSVIRTAALPRSLYTCMYMAMSALCIPAPKSQPALYVCALTHRGIGAVI